MLKYYLEAAVKGKEQYLYHVTKTSNVPKIKKKGLVMMQTSNWVKGDFTRYGKGEIYAFEHQRDAIQWAARMDWSLNQEVGSGKISIIKFKKTGKWVVDTNDPLSQAGNKGVWYKKVGTVEPSDIISAVPVTLVHTKKLVGDEEIPDIFLEAVHTEPEQKREYLLKVYFNSSVVAKYHLENIISHIIQIIKHSNIEITEESQQGMQTRIRLKTSDKKVYYLLKQIIKDKEQRSSGVFIDIVNDRTHNTVYRLYDNGEIYNANV